MALSAKRGTETIFSWLQTDDSWLDVQGWSKHRELTMDCCGFRAKATRSSLGLKHFAHVRTNPACNAGYESPEHQFLKAEVLKTAHELGFDAYAEENKGKAVPDVRIVDRATKRQISVEIQLSRQTGFETRTRTNNRAALGMDSVWFLGKRRDYDDVPQTQRHVLPLLLPEGDVKAVQAPFVRERLTAYLTGELRFDDFSDLAEVPCSLVGYDFPCGTCGSSWHRTSFVALYPNRVRGDFRPSAIPISKLSDPAATLSAFERKWGRFVGRLAGDHLVCPHCGAVPEAEFLSADVAAQAPIDVPMSKHDMRWFPKSTRRNNEWRRRTPCYVEERTTDPAWAGYVAEHLDEIQRARKAAAERRRLEEEHRRQVAERGIAQRNAIRAETEWIRRSLAPHVGDDVVTAWLAASLPAFGLWTPQMIINQHVERSETLPPDQPSEAVGLVRRMLDPRDSMKGVGCGFAHKDVRRIRRSAAAARRRAEASNGGPGILQRAWRALLG